MASGPDFIVDNATIDTPQNYQEHESWKLYFDGSRHKYGVVIGVQIISPNKNPIKFKYKIDGPCSNNEVEYEALIADLEILLKLGATRVEIGRDSELVVMQITKEYKCVKENLIMYFVIANRLLQKFEFVNIIDIPQLKNQEANDLTQIAYGYKV